MLTIEGRGARDVAKRAHETTGQVFRYAIAHGIANRNPAADFKPKDILGEAKEANFARVDVRELPHLLAKLEGYDGGCAYPSCHETDSLYVRAHIRTHRIRMVGV